MPFSKASTATTYTTATGLPHPRSENIPPTQSSESIGVKHKDSLEIPTAKLLPKITPKAPKPKSRAGLPKSRTLNVFSNLTSSLSRTSLGSFARSESRHTSTSSTATSQDIASSLGSGNMAAASTHSLLGPTPNLNSPRQIHTAQSSAYWTGRFVALQDRFHSEMLMPENLATLVNAYAEHSLVPSPVPASAKHSLALSATTNCIGTASSPRKQSQHLQKSKHKHTHSTSTLASITSKYRDSAETAALLSDEDNRSRRVFLHLEALCTTAEARHSLHAWQQTYARRMGKENLLPRGGSMEDGGREGARGWVGRLLSGSVSHGKRGSFAL